MVHSRCALREELFLCSEEFGKAREVEGEMMLVEIREAIGVQIVGLRQREHAEEKDNPYGKSDSS